MPEKRKTTRRKMLAEMAGATLALPAFISCAYPPMPSSADGAAPSPESQKLARSPNERIGIGVIGCGRRNGQLMAGIGGQGAPPAHARIVALADFNLRRTFRWGMVHGVSSRYQYQDYRKLLDQKDVDVVVYATPEHWHYLPCIHACQAGKDIYGEQPLGHTIAEGQMMIQAVRKYKRIFQTGEQQRSHPTTRKAVELIRNGRIGKIRRVIGYNYPSAWECDFPAQPIPEELNWDAWCGPNPVVPYHTDLYVSRAPYNPEGYYAPFPAEKCAVGPGWMSFRPYSGGELPNWGCHGLSMVHWGLDMDESGPVEVWVEPAEKMETVTYHEPESPARGDALCSKTFIHYKYANGVVLSLTSRDKKLGGGGTFIGDKGKITIFREGYECDPVDLDKDPLPSDAVRVYESDNHMHNFFDCVVSRKDPIMKIENGHSVANLCHLGNIARRLGRRLKWDPEKEVFPGDEEANSYLDFERRKPYELPSKV